MGIKERRDREKDELRGKILDAARELILEQGVEAISMRKIADRIEYSATAIYQHFEDKDALLRAMCERDFGAMNDSMRQRTSEADDVIERIMMLGEGYVRFAVDYPSHFRVMFMTPSAHPSEMNASDKARQGNPENDSYAYLIWAVQQAMDAGRLRAELTDVQLVAQTFWAAVHGVAALQIAKADDPWLPMAPLEQRVGLAVEAIMRGMMRDPAELDVIVARRAATGEKAVIS